MDAARFLTQFSVLMGLSSAALMLILSLCFSTPLPSLSLPEPYSLPALKSFCVDSFCSMWSLLHHSSLQPDVLLSSRNLFLLVNLIVLVLLINLHLQKHAAPAAAGKRSSRKKKEQHTEKLVENDYVEAMAAVPLQRSLQEVPLADDLASQADAAMAKEGLSRSVCAADLDAEESSIAEGAPVEESSMKKLDDEAQTFPAVDSDGMDGSNAQQIVVAEDGRLRLDGGLMESVTDGSDAEKTVQLAEEDGRLMELLDGSDEGEKIVLEEDGRLRLIDKPQLPSSSKPQKSHSTGDKNVGKNHLNGNYETQSPDNFNCDTNAQSPNHTDSLINHDDSLDSPNLNHDDNHLSEINSGALVLDLSASSTNNHNLNDEDAYGSSNNHNDINNNLNHNHNNNTSNSNVNNNNYKSSPIKRTGSRPMRPYKKSESMDATWKAINKNKGIAGSSRDHRGPLIRQSSRQGFKPSGRGLARSSNNTSRVRREPSISQEELNAKVESFIAKFNEQMRIQRQQSILSYMQMVDRGA